MQSLTGHPGRENPFEGQVELLPFNFGNPGALTASLQGTDTLFNTYWIRAGRRGRSHQQCVEQTKTMFYAARDAGVRRIVHISILNPDPESDLPYYQGKGQLEQALRKLEGISHAILRPTVLYSLDDVLLNNMAWTLRTFPLVLMPGRGDYYIQPIFVEDLARLAAQAAESDENTIVDAVGPDTYTYRQLLRTLRAKTRSKCLILPAPGWAALLAGKALGLALSDMVITGDEIKGLRRNLLASPPENRPTAPTRLSLWLDQNAAALGKRYASEVARHYS